MTTDAVPPTPPAVPSSARHPWILPRLTELPRLTSLTLASAIGGGGGTGGGGSTVFGLFLALLAVSACLSERAMTPSDGAMPAAVTAVTCTADVPAKAVLCGGPMNAPDETIGGQGTHVILRSTNVLYAGTDFTFEVQVQNAGAQSIGTDGVDLTGVRVFFQGPPVITSGAGAPITIEDDSTGTFTAVGQSYYVYADSLARSDTSAWVPWRFAVANGINSFTFQVLISAQVPDQGGILRWAPAGDLATFEYNDVASSGPDDAMAVGSHGHSKRWNGTTWTAIPPITGVDLRGVTGVSPGVYLAVGDSGKVFRFAGNVWTLVHQSPAQRSLRAAWARDADHWYVVGDLGTIIEYDAGVWTEVQFGGSSLHLVAGTASDATTIATNNLGVSYASISGGPWAPVPSLIAPGWFLGAIAFDDEENLIKAMLDLNTGDGHIVRGGATVSLLPGTVAVELWPFDDDSLIAAVSFLGNEVTAAVKFVYGAVTPDTTQVSPFFPDENILAMAKLDEAGTEFGGIGQPKTLLTTLGGGPWAWVEGPNDRAFVGSWGIGDSVWVITESGELWKIVDGDATLLVGVVGASSIWGFSGDELFIAAGTTIWRGDGVGPWSVENLPSASYFILDLWGDPASETLVAIGEDGMVFERIGGLWNELVPVAFNLRGIWGCSATEAWIVSGNGDLLKWAPGSLTPAPNYTYGPGLAAATGTGCDDVWVAGPSSILFHWDGADWDQVPISGSPIAISDLAPRGVGAVYVAGEAAKLASVTTTGLTSRMLVHNQLKGIDDLWTLDNGDLVVGTGSILVIGQR